VAHDEPKPESIVGIILAVASGVAALAGFGWILLKVAQLLIMAWTGHK
jgi:hypothetical protein